MNKLTNYSDDEINDVLQKSKSFSDVLRYFRYESITTGNYKIVKNELVKRNIPIPVYNFFKEHNNFNRGKTIEELFVKDSTTSRGHLKKVIIKEKLIEYVCECGNSGEWRSKKLVLQLEHKNGDTNDNRLENLCFLCPNCHSQTGTFSGKNTKRVKRNLKRNFKNNICDCGKSISYDAIKCTDCYSKSNRIVERPSYEQLKKEIDETSQNSVSKKYNVSWRTIKKWLVYYEKKDRDPSRIRTNDQGC